MDVRGRRLRKQSDEVTAFTSSMAFDGQIAAAVIRTNMAHMVALVEAREVDAKVGARCLAFLRRASPSVKPGTKAEDFHQHLEQRAVNALGVDTAGYLNLGKSRNDQVATALRMRMREKILGLLSETIALQRALVALVREDGARLLPGYTHLQRAQPITFGHHFLAHFDSFQRSVERLLQLYARVNVSPMGSAALGGTSVKVNRRKVADLLGFGGVSTNAMDSVASRDLASEALACSALIMVDVSRIAEEFVLWSSKEFGFVEVSDEYATSSSIMPQKKNPVVAEVARAKFGSVLGALVASLSISKALPFAYNLDLQEVTLHLWRGLDDATESVRMTTGMLETSKFNFEAIRKSMDGDYSTATNLANYLVAVNAISFRKAHAIVGELVRTSLDEGTTLEEAAARRLEEVSAKLGKKVQMDEKTIAGVLDPDRFLSEITTKGGSNPKFIASDLRVRSRQLDKSSAALSDLSGSLAKSERLLTATVGRIVAGVRS